MLKGPNQLAERVPIEVGKLLDIFRVFYNFVEVGRNKQTPGNAAGTGKGQDNC